MLICIYNGDFYMIILYNAYVERYWTEETMLCPYFGAMARHGGHEKHCVPRLINCWCSRTYVFVGASFVRAVLEKPRTIDPSQVSFRKWGEITNFQAGFLLFPVRWLFRWIVNSDHFIFISVNSPKCSWWCCEVTLRFQMVATYG
jgi:hypothetical protein